MDVTQKTRVIVLALCIFSDDTYNWKSFMKISETLLKLYNLQQSQRYNSKNTQKRFSVFAICIRSDVCFIIVLSSIKILQTISKLQGRHEILGKRFEGGEGAVTPIMYKRELSFLHAPYPFLIFYICIKLHESISNGIQVIEQTICFPGNKIFLLVQTPDVMGSKTIFDSCLSCKFIRCAFIIPLGPSFRIHRHKSCF